MQKKNNWLKFKTDFFASLEMKKIRKIAGGDSYIIIYQKLMLLTVNTEGHYHLSGIEPTIEEELALIIDEDVDNVKVAINILKSLNLINHDNNVIFLNKVPDLIGKTDDSSLRVAAYRERKKLQCNALQSLQVTESNVPREREREREREDIDKKINKKGASNDALLCIEYFNQLNGTKNTGDKTVIAGLNKILQDYTIDDVKKVIDFMYKSPLYQWQRESGYNSLSALSKHTKFYEKLEKSNTVIISREEIERQQTLMELANSALSFLEGHDVL